MNGKHDVDEGFYSDGPAFKAWEDSELFRLVQKLEERRERTNRKAQPDSYPISKIVEYPQLFQPRDEMLEERHVGELGNGLRDRRTSSKLGELDQVLLIAVGSKAIVVDGHHRLEAYRRAKRAHIPAKWCEGTIKEAILAAGSENSKPRRVMSLQERLNSAWRLVKLNIHSKREIADMASISPRQVGTMRQTAAKLGKTALVAKTWGHARWALAEIEEPKSRERDEMVENQSRINAEKLAKVFQTKLLKDPEIAARTLQKYFGDRLGAVLEWLKKPENAEDDFQPTEGKPYPFIGETSGQEGMHT